MDCESQLPSIRFMEFGTSSVLQTPREDVNSQTDFTSMTLDMGTEEQEDFGDEEEIVEVENVTVKFRISDTDFVAQVYPNRMILADVKKDIARKFEVDSNKLKLYQCGTELSDECRILDTNSNEYGIHEFYLELKIDDDESSEHVKNEDGFAKVTPKLDVNVYYEKYTLPEFITVHIPGENTEDGQPKDIVVEIQNKAIVKPFLCGYRDSATGIEYLDAFTQTGPYFDYWLYRRFRSRDTQTAELKEKLIDTTHDQMSQCFLDGNNVLHVSEAHDFTIIPKKYQSYAQKERQERRLQKIILIQKNWRRFIIVRFMKNAAAQYRQLIANREEDEKNFREELPLLMQQEELAKMFPRTKHDFDLLYTEVQKWKKAEMQRIIKMHDGPARVVEINILLTKEIDMLNKLERQRRIAADAFKSFRENQLLKKLGKPISWIGYKDNIIHLDLLRTQRARFLYEIYTELKQPKEKEERLEFIEKLKYILVNEEDFPDITELYDLLEREKNLLIYTRYVDAEILHKRQLILFKELIKYSKDKPKEYVDQRMCVVCRKVKPVSTFAINTRQNVVDTCKKCYYLRVSETNTVAYTAILRSIQRSERRKRCSSSIAFVMQVDDLRYLIDNIWHGHSILSKQEDINTLRLPRWIRSDDWSPWNCICLTAEEARSHSSLENVENVYDPKLVQQIKNKHLLARNLFHKLTAVSTEFVETGQWFNVGLNLKREVNKY